MARPPDVRVGLTLSPEAQRLFSTRDWQRGMRAALIVAGRDFIATALPKRFTSFASEDLGYSAKKMDRSESLSDDARMRQALATMREDGSRARLVALYCAPWGGWDPTAKAGPSTAVWRAWYQQALALGRVPPAKDQAGWLVARREMRRSVLEQSRLKERLKNYARDEYVDQDKEGPPIPLVDSGWLRRHALANARPTGKTRGGAAELKIVVPRGDRVSPVVARVLRQKTATESRRVADVTAEEMQNFIRTARVRGTARRPRLASTARQQRRIGSIIRSSQTASARGRASTKRPKTPTTARK